MNNIWSKHIQGINTLYYSRLLRFNDMFKDQYKRIFSLDENIPLKILEIGCGPGALAGAMLRWYPKSEVIGIDRDSAFIEFATENEKGITFYEGDATALPFEDNCFDVIISNTVAEHIEPEKFYGEQFRVLKPGGVCIVLSARRGITINSKCIDTQNDLESEFWKRAEELDSRMEKYSICKYPMNEAEMPSAMCTYGFTNVSTGYATINLTPDNPSISKELAHMMINAQRETALDGIINTANELPDAFTNEEIVKMIDSTNRKYDLRIKQYDCAEKQWDTNVSVTMVIRGVK